MNFRKPSGRGNAIKHYANPVMYKVFNPIYVKHHPLFPCHLFQNFRTIMKCNSLHVHNLKTLLARND